MAETIRVDLPAHGWLPLPHQREAYYAMTKFDKLLYVLAWHRRAGKDDVSLHTTAQAAVKRVGNYVHLLTKKEQAKTAIWNGVNPLTGRRRWMDAFPKELIAKISEVDKTVYFKNGSTWKVDGIDNYENIVGGSPVGIIMSEFAQASPQAFAYLRPIVRQNKGWIAAVSSVRGQNHFYDLFKTAKSNPKEAYASWLSADDTDVFTAEELAEEEQYYISIYGEKIGRAIFQQEYKSNWIIANIGSIFSEEVEKMRSEGRITICRHDPLYPVTTSWDFGVSDLTTILFWQTVGNEERLIDVFSGNNKGFAYYKNAIDRRALEKDYSYNLHLAPHDGNNRTFMDAESIRTSAQKNYNFNFMVMPKQAKSTSIADISALLGRTVINADVEKYFEIGQDSFGNCAVVVAAIEGYKYKYDKINKISSKNPIHDWTSHYVDAVGVYAEYKKLYTSTGKRFTENRFSRSIYPQGGPHRVSGYGLG